MIGPILAVDAGPYTGLKAVLVGGGPTSQPLLDAATRAGIPVLSTYGMTETASQIATAPLGDGPRRRALPLAGAQIRIAPGGEIEVAGPMVSERYLGEPGHSTWLATGDLGRIDDEGFLHVLGRTRDLIITGGENVIPAEIETLLEEVDEVDEVAVVGIPDRTWGEAVVAVVATSAPGWGSGSPPSWTTRRLQDPQTVGDRRCASSKRAGKGGSGGGPELGGASRWPMISRSMGAM